MSEVNVYGLLKSLIAYARNDVPIHKQLFLLRMILGKKQGDIARTIGCYQTDVSNIESGKRRPSFEQIERYCEVMNVQVILVPKSLVGFLSEVLTIAYNNMAKNAIGDEDETD